MDGRHSKFEVELNVHDEMLHYDIRIQQGFYIIPEIVIQCVDNSTSYPQSSPSKMTEDIATVYCRPLA